MQTNAASFFFSLWVRATFSGCVSFSSGGGSPFSVTMLPLCGIGSVEGKGKGMSAGRLGTDVEGVSFVGTHSFFIIEHYACTSRRREASKCRQTQQPKAHRSLGTIF